MVGEVQRREQLHRTAEVAQGDRAGGPGHAFQMRRGGGGEQGDIVVFRQAAALFGGGNGAERGLLRGGGKAAGKFRAIVPDKFVMKESGESGCGMADLTRQESR